MIKIINAVGDKTVTMYVEYKNCTLNELILELEMNKESIGAVLVNGAPKKLTERIIDDSEIYLLPVLSGGC